VIFQNGGYRHLVFLNFGNFIYRKGQESQTASVYTISCRSEKQMLRYGDFSIFQNGGRRHLGFLKFQNCNGQKVQEGQTASLCQSSCRSVKLFRRFDDFFIFKMAAVHLGFSNFGNFNSSERSRWPNCVPVQNFVEIGQTAAEIWRFFDSLRWRPSAILDL